MQDHLGMQEITDFSHPVTYTYIQNFDVILASGWVGLLLGCVLNKPMLDVLKLGHHGTFFNFSLL
jgi:hypothetical protein